LASIIATASPIQRGGKLYDLPLVIKALSAPRRRKIRIFRRRVVALVGNLWFVFTFRRKITKPTNVHSYKQGIIKKVVKKMTEPKPT